MVQAPPVSHVHVRNVPADTSRVAYTVIAFLIVVAAVEVLLLARELRATIEGRWAYLAFATALEEAWGFRPAIASLHAVRCAGVAPAVGSSGQRDEREKRDEDCGEEAHFDFRVRWVGGLAGYMLL